MAPEVRAELDGDVIKVEVSNRVPDGITDIRHWDLDDPLSGPPLGSDRHPGYEEAARLVHALAAGVGAALATVALGPDGGAAAGERIQVEGWQGLIGWLDENVRPDDLVVVMSARRDTVAWHPRLERVPAALAAMGRASFIAVYPREDGAAGVAALEDGGEQERVA